MAKKQINNDDLLANIIKGIEEVKGENIDILDLRAIDNTVCDYFVICNGNSNTQVNAIVGSIQKIVSKELKDKREEEQVPVVEVDLNYLTKKNTITQNLFCYIIAHQHIFLEIT